jgi:phage-related protein
LCYNVAVSGWILVYYATTAGRCPVQEYLDDLGPVEAAKVSFDLDLLKAFGLNLGAPYVRSLQGKLWELRTRGRNQHRILYCDASGRRLILLHAFTKKTAKTPPGEIETAMRRLVDYQERER